MAQKVEVTLIDDISGDEGATTVEFGLDGVTYEIDVTEKNETALRDAMAEFVANARRTGGRARRAGRAAGITYQQGAPASPGRKPARVDREQTKAIRDWARRNGYTVSERGRIPGEITAAYQRAGGQ